MPTPTHVAAIPYADYIAAFKRRRAANKLKVAWWTRAMSDPYVAKKMVAAASGQTTIAGHLQLCDSDATYEDHIEAGERRHAEAG
jgi:hypothetical protein